MTGAAFKCPVCGGDVMVRAQAYGYRGMVADVELTFRCVGCGRWVTYDATDAAFDAFDEFACKVKRIEGDGK